MTGRLLIFCGIPGSGKTTVARLVADHLGRSFHIQTDAIRRMISGPDYSAKESRTVYTAAISVANAALRAGYDVILDGTFLREEYRRDAIAKLRRHYSSCTVVHVSCNPRVAYDRNISREDVVPFESYVRLCSRFEPPKKALTVNTTTLSPAKAAEIVTSAI